jgi:hypothetical protein
VNEVFEIAKNESVLIPFVAYFMFVTISKIHFKLAILHYSNNSTNTSSNYIYVCSIGLFGARIVQSEQLLVYVLDNRGIGIRFPAGQENFCSPQNSVRL